MAGNVLGTRLRPLFRLAWLPNDLFVVPNVTSKVLFVVAALAHDRRRIVHIRCRSRSPSLLPTEGRMNTRDRQPGYALIETNVPRDRWIRNVLNIRPIRHRSGPSESTF